MGALPTAKAGVGSAMNDLVRQVAGALGVAIIGSVVNTVYASRMDDVVAVVGLVISMIALSAILGQRHRDRATGDPYESGIISTGTARVRLSVHFYLVAMLFVIFDLEAVFIFAWAIGARTLGWPGYLGVVVFIMILTVALVYEWRLGALEWRTGSQVRSGNNRARQGVR